MKARMEQRLGSVNALKDRASPAKTTRAISRRAAARQLPISESSARRTPIVERSMPAIAAQDRCESGPVGQKRAQQIASIARKGHWIQDAAARGSRSEVASKLAH